MEDEVIVISSDSEEDELDHRHDDLDRLFNMTIDEWNQYCASIPMAYL